VTVWFLSTDSAHRGRAIEPTAESHLSDYDRQYIDR
jgi:hypothetical protein